MNHAPIGNRKDQKRGVSPALPPYSRRKFLQAMGLAAAGVLLDGCNAIQPAPSAGERTIAGGEKVQLVYQDWRTDWFPAMAQHSLEQFHTAHPNTRVFYTPDPDDLEETMLADMQAGTAPDVFQGCCSHFPIWAQEGHLLDLRPYVEADLDQATIADWDKV